MTANVADTLDDPSARHGVEPGTGDLWLIVGCGYVGARLAVDRRERGDAVLCTAQTRRQTPLAGPTIDWPLQLGHSIDRIPDPVDSVLRTVPAERLIVVVTVPPEPGNDSARLRRLLDGLDRHGVAPATLLYASSTAMYGDHAGASVAEDADCRSTSPRALARLDDERLVAEWAAARPGRRAASLRLSGIYGPGRLPYERLQGGGRSPALLCPSVATPGNRVHVDDIVTAFDVVADHVRTRSPGDAGRLDVFNVAADDHASHTQFVWWLADALHRPRPGCTANVARWRQDHPGLAAFLSDARIVDSRRLRALGWRPRYDDTRVGLRAALTAERAATGA